MKGMSSLARMTQRWWAPVTRTSSMTSRCAPRTWSGGNRRNDRTLAAISRSLASAQSVP